MSRRAPPIDEFHLVRARLRTEVRVIDDQIAGVLREDRLFRRYGFGSDVHEIKLSALRAERAERVLALSAAGSTGKRRATGRGGFGSWLVLPAVVGAMIVRALRPRCRPRGWTAAPFPRER